MSLISLASVTATLIINLLLSAFVQYLLEFFNDLSFMIILSVIAIDVPGVTKLYQAQLLQLIYLDLFLTDQWLVPLIFKNSNSNDDDLSEDPNSPLNWFFLMSGFETKIAIKNLGSNIIYLAIVLQLLILIPTLSFISFFIPWFQKPADYLKKKLLWNGLLKFLMQ